MTAAPSPCAHLRSLTRAWYHRDSHWMPDVQDWDGFWGLIRRHGLDGMAGCLAAHGACFPEPLRERATAAYFSNVLRYRQAETLCSKISRSAGEVPLSVVKGPALAAAYGDDGIRGFGDIDVLVPDAGSAFGLASACGLTVKHGTIETPAVFWKRAREIGRIEASDARLTVEFTHGADAANQPLHTFVTQWPERFLLRADASQAFPVPEDHAHILFLLQHIAMHWCNRMVWVVDFAVLMRQRRFDRDWLEEAAGQMEMRRLLHAITRFCNREIDPGLPVLCQDKPGWKDGLFLTMLSDGAWERGAFFKYAGGKWAEWVADPVLGALAHIVATDLSAPSGNRTRCASRWTRDWLQYVIHPGGNIFCHLIVPIIPFLFLVMLLLLGIAFRRGPRGFLRLAAAEADADAALPNTRPLFNPATDKKVI